MATKKDIAIQVLDKEQAMHTEGVFRVTQLDGNDRLIRALKILIIFWLLAGVTLFIPIVHFFSVPGFLIAGPIAAYMKYGMHQISENVTGMCPVCQEKIVLGLEAKDSPPIWTYCPECRGPLHIKEP